jgi:hypothetical protein
MSVLELSFSLARSYTQTLQEHDYPQIIVSAQLRRTVIMGCAFFALVCAIVYLYMVASIVSLRADQTRVRTELRRAESGAQSVEQAALTEGRLYTMDYFKSFGYEEPRSFVTLKRSPNGTEPISISRAR